MEGFIKHIEGVGVEPGAEGEQIAQSELQRRMESAIRAMNQAQEAMEGNLSPDEMQRAAEEAQRQLQGAREQVAQDQLNNLQDSFANMAGTGEDMLRAQERMATQLREAMERALEERESGDNPNSRGMSLQEEWTLAREKQELAAELRSLQQQMLDAIQNHGAQMPGAGRELGDHRPELSPSDGVADQRCSATTAAISIASSSRPTIFPTLPVSCRVTASSPSRTRPSRDSLRTRSSSSSPATRDRTAP